MDLFKQLTRGIHFNTSKFTEEAQKFGLKKVQCDAAPRTAEPEFEISPIPCDENNSDEIDSGEGSEDDDEEEVEETELTLLGNIKTKVRRKADKEKQKKSKSKACLAQLRQESVNRFRNINRIHVTGSDVPDPLPKWTSLKERFGVPEPLLEVIASHFPNPTPVQMQAVPCLLERRELLVCAPTGSGKTAAYLIPLVHHLREHRKKGFRAVIVAPTRELALQIHREAVKLAECRGIRTLVLDKMNKATKKFNDHTSHFYDILVSTPNRLVFMLKDESISLKTVEWLVVDESDKLFEAGARGFREQLAVIYRACSEAAASNLLRRAMFSATLAVDVENWCKLNMDNVATVTIGTRNTATQSVEQKLVYTGTEKGKLLAFRNIVSEGIKPPVLVFVQTKERAKELFSELSINGNALHVDVIHSERSELQRDASVKAFRSGRVWILICTELMGRGIDFKGVNLVVNYDFPPSTVSYIHRIGRTGRAGRPGKAVTFFTDQDKTLLRSVATIVKQAGGEVDPYLLTLKKASRQEKRRLAKSAVKREDIRGESKYDKEKRIKREQMIAASKRKKRKLDGEGSGNEAKKQKTEGTVVKKSNQDKLCDRNGGHLENVNGQNSKKKKNKAKSVV